MVDRNGLHARFLELARAGDIDELRAELRALAAEHPADAFVRLYCGASLAIGDEPDRPDAAITEVKAAVEMEPDDPVVLARVGGGFGWWLASR